MQKWKFMETASQGSYHGNDIWPISLGEFPDPWTNNGVGLGLVNR